LPDTAVGVAHDEGGWNRTQALDRVRHPSRTAGEIDVETSPGCGTTFIVRFPVATFDQSTVMSLRRSA
jgi:hypothetical protein